MLISSGVVHRDIKPANLLVEAVSPLALTESEAEALGVGLWVTDFGLAHCRQGQVRLDRHRRSRWARSAT